MILPKKIADEFLETHYCYRALVDEINGDEDKGESKIEFGDPICRDFEALLTETTSILQSFRLRAYRLQDRIENRRKTN
jgi:hypothetical protein